MSAAAAPTVRAAPTAAAVIAPLRQDPNWLRHAYERIEVAEVWK